MAKKPKHNTTAEFSTKSLRIDVKLVTEQKAQLPWVLASLREYRHALRTCYELLEAAQSMTATIEWTDGDNCRVTPVSNDAKVVCALLNKQATAALVPPPARAEGEKAPYGEGVTYAVKIGKGAVYELRTALLERLPTAITFVNDAARRCLNTAWTARDPEIQKATRGWLTLQGARGLARFAHRGIEIPIATGKPQFDGYKIGLKWDKNKDVLWFSTGDLDPYRRHIWRCLLDGDEGWSMGTVTLNERDGKLFITIAYTKPNELAVGLDPKKVLQVTVDDEDVSTLFRLCHGSTVFTLAKTNLIGLLNKHRRERAYLEERKGSCGNPRRPWGYKKGWEAVQRTIDNETKKREGILKDHNHVWTKAIVDKANKWKCGVVEVGVTPKRSFGSGSGPPSPPVGSIGEHPWNWTQFREFMRYKTREVGMSVVFLDDAPVTTAPAEEPRDPTAPIDTQTPAPEGAA